MRLLSIGRPLPNSAIDNHTIFNAPAAFDYDAIVIDPEGVFASIHELLDASRKQLTYADVQVVNGQANAEATAAEVLRRRHDEFVRALDRGALVVVFTHPQSLITEVSGFSGVDRYFFLPAPAGLAWDASLIRWGEGTGAIVVNHRHPFARYIDAIRDDLLYRAYFDERTPGFADNATIFARSPGGAPLGVEFRVLNGNVVFLPSPRKRGGDAGRDQASAILVAIQELLGRLPDDRPGWVENEAVPGLDEREAELQEATDLVQRAEEQRNAAAQEAEPLRRVSDVLWTEGRQALLPAALRCLELLGFSSQDNDGEVALRTHKDRLDLEVEGSTEPVGMAPHYRLRARLDARIKREGKAPRGLVVVNGERLQVPGSRKASFEDALRVAAEATSYALLPAPELFQAACAALTGASEETLEELRTRLIETNGLVTLTDLLGDGASTA